MDSQNITPEPTPEAPKDAKATSDSKVKTILENKKLVKYIAFGGAALIVIVAAALVLPALFGVSKTDYSEAGSKISEVKTSYNKIGSTYISAHSTETEIRNGLETIESAKEDFTAKFEELGATKAIRRDGELAKLYDEVEKKKPDFDKALDATLESYKKVLPAVTGVSKLPSSGSNLADEIVSLKKKFDDISGLENDSNKEFVSKMSDLLEKYATLARKVQEGRDDYKKYDSSVSREFYTTATEISEATRDWQSNIKKLAEKGELREDLKALDDALFQKTIRK